MHAIAIHDIGAWYTQVQLMQNSPIRHVPTSAAGGSFCPSLGTMGTPARMVVPSCAAPVSSEWEGVVYSRSSVYIQRPHAVTYTNYKEVILPNSYIYNINCICIVRPEFVHVYIPLSSSHEDIATLDPIGSGLPLCIYT